MYLYRERGQLSKWNMVVVSPILIVFLLPFSIFLYQRTGNPFFPFYNAVLRSPYLVS